MPDLSDRKYPKVDVRVSPELQRRIKAEAVLDGVRLGACAKALWVEALEARALRRASKAVEQAPGDRGGPPAASGGDGAGSGIGRAPAPAESPKWVQRYRCPRDCNPSFRPPSDSANCRVCGRKTTVKA